MNVFIILYFFILGLALGSFTLAMVDRMKTGRDWVRGRSECEYCKHRLKPVDLIPLFSWLSTKGKCRHCKKSLSAAYPVAELGVGLSFLVSYFYWPYELTSAIAIAQFIVWLISCVLLAGLFIFDVRWFLLPNKLVRPLIVLGIIWMVLDFKSQGLSYTVIIDYILAVLVGAGLFFVLYKASKGRWIGDGDIRLGVAIGLFTGTLLEAWMVLFLASVLGIVVAIPFLKKTDKKKRMKLKIPFGPMLIAALYCTVLFGAAIIEWYKLNILYL